MTPGIILSDFTCRHCRKPISLTFTNTMPWLKREGGCLCENCIVKEQENLRRLQKASEEFNSKDVYIDIDGVAPPCAVCDTIFGDERVIEDYEGEKAFLCKPCADKYLLANRAKLVGTKLEFDLKLR